MMQTTTNRMNRITLVCFAVTMWTLGASCGSNTQGLPNPIPVLTEPDEIVSVKKFFVTPFHNPEQGGRTMSLTAPALDAIVLELLSEQALDPRFQVKSQVSPAATGLGLVQLGGSSNLYDFYLDEVKVYHHQIKASVMPGLAPLIFGQMPAVSNFHVYSMDEWPNADTAEGLIWDKASAEYNIEEPSTIERERCYYMYRGELVPAWRMVIGHHELQYEAVADQSTVYTFFPLFLDVDGTASIYPNNRLDGSTQSFALHNLVTTGRLENDKFKTSLWSGSSETPASSSTYTFKFTPGTSQFDETSLFANINRHLEWLVTNGFDVTGFKQIKVVPHAELQGDVNNALYQPDSSGYNTVYIGDGDGVTLQNLATDADVVSHEFSHHVIYKSITNIDNDMSLVLHEALADTLTYYRTGNACLGESICPTKSQLCVSSTCLRTGLNTYSYGSSNLPSEAHLKSQFVSGMMWDLHAKDNMSLDTLSKTLINAITYLPSSAGYEHLVMALMYADKALNSSAYCGTIYARAAERGLYSLISSFGCGSTFPQMNSLPEEVTKYPGIMNAFPDSLPAGGTSSTSTSSSSSSHKSKGICGLALGNEAATPGTLLAWLIPLLSPLFTRCNAFRMNFGRKRRDD